MRISEHESRGEGQLVVLDRLEKKRGQSPPDERDTQDVERYPQQLLIRVLASFKEVRLKRKGTQKGERNAFRVTWC